jgi:UbiA prenyltransferase family
VTGFAPGPWLRACAVLAAGGALLAVVSGEAHFGAVHRLIAALVAPPLAALLAAAWVSHRSLVPSVLTASALFAAAAAVPGHASHAVFAALALASLLVVVVQSRRGARIPWGSWRDYVSLTKPRIMSLLLVTGFCGMIAGARGWPGTETAVAATVGLALACGGASALNHVLDRDIDPLMGERTKRRPVASGRVPASRALEFGLALSALSFVLLASAVNLLTAVLALVGNLFYVIVYTRWLKRTTSQNIVIGGAAGAAPRRAISGSRHGRSSQSCSCGRRRISGRSRSSSRTTTRTRRCRCSQSCAAIARRRGRSSCTRSCCSR